MGRGFVVATWEYVRDLRCNVRFKMGLRGIRVVTRGRGVDGFRQGVD